MNLTHHDLMTTLDALAKHKRFNRAAGTLHYAPETLLYRLKRLEEKAEEPMFYRQPSGRFNLASPTPAARRLLQDWRRRKGGR